ncbi:MAG: MFS transporter [Bacillota bacterium]|nr:MFS transporter [Bacillota bacterium]
MYPARQALLPQIVPQQELVHANSLMTMAQQLVFIGGYAAGGMLIAALGVMPLFTIDSVSFSFRPSPPAALRPS